MTQAASTAPELLTDGAYAPDGGAISLFGGMVDYTVSKKYDKVAAIAIDVPSVRQVIDGLAKGFFEKKGIALTPIYVGPTTPDLTPAVTQATQGGNKAVVIIGNAAFCGAAMKAIAAVGATDLDRIVIGPCVEKDAIKASPPEVLKGSHLITWFAPDSNDSEGKLYRAVLAKYAPDADGSGLSGAGYSDVLAFARALAKITGEITPATIKAALDSATDIPLPLGAGNTFTCGAKLSTLFKSVCSGGYIVDKIAADGSVSFVSKGDASYLIKS
jgi:branched-chain amino acid transport system substrate-binding protein